MPIQQPQKRQDNSMSDAMSIYNAYKSFSGDKPKEVSQPGFQQDATQGSAVDSGKLEMTPPSLPAEGPAAPPAQDQAAAGSPSPGNLAMQRSLDQKRQEMAQNGIKQPGGKNQNDGGLGSIAGILGTILA